MPNRFDLVSPARLRRRPLLYAGLVSLVLWYASVALVLTGHTRILWGIGQVLTQAGHVVTASYASLRWLEGDRNIPADDPSDA